MKQNWLLAVGLLLLLFAISSSSIQAQGGDLEEEVKEIAKILNCPVCQGLTLYECPLAVCEDWRGLIRQKLAAGETREEIIQYFIAQYGEQVLNYPQPQGFNWLAWLLPFLALGAGLAWLLFQVRDWLRRRQQPGVGSEPTLPEYLKKVEEELKGWK